MSPSYSYTIKYPDARVEGYGYSFVLTSSKYISQLQSEKAVKESIENFQLTDFQYISYLGKKKSITNLAEEIYCEDNCKITVYVDRYYDCKDKWNSNYCSMSYNGFMSGGWVYRDVNQVIKWNFDDNLLNRLGESIRGFVLIQKIVSNADIDEITKLVDARVNFEYEAQFRWGSPLHVTPLNAAIFANRTDVVANLLECGADPNFVPKNENVNILLAKDPTITYPLFMAVYMGHLAITKLLLEKGANIHYSDGLLYHDAISLAQDTCRMDIIELLLQSQKDEAWEQNTLLGTLDDEAHLLS